MGGQNDKERRPLQWRSKHKNALPVQEMESLMDKSIFFTSGVQMRLIYNSKANVVHRNVGAQTRHPGGHPSIARFNCQARELE
jgi:hypothetical protein